MKEPVIATYDLIEQGQYREARVALGPTRRATFEGEVLSQLLAVDTSDAASAGATALRLLQRNLNTRERALCLFVVARAAALQGHDNEARETSRTAVSLAAKTNDRTLLARAQARYATVVLRCLGIEAALPELKQLRQFAFAAGDPASLIEFHCLVAEVEMKQRRYQDALAQLATAQSLCERFPHLRLQAQIYRLQANAALFTSRVADAKRCGLAAVDTATRSGGYLSLVACLSTFAHACLLSGALDEAESTLNRILALPGPEASRLAAIDGLIQVALDRQDKPEADRLVSLLETFASKSNTSYYWLWHVPVRARWLIRRGQPAEALLLLERFSAAAAATRDQQLQHTFRITEAEAIAAAGDASAAAARLAIALSSDGPITLGSAVSLNTIAAQFFGGEPSVERNLRRRAGRIRELAIVHSNKPVASDEKYGSVFELLHAAASFFTVPTRPQLLAHDVVALLRGAGVATAKVEMNDRAESVRVVPGVLSVDGDATTIECGEDSAVNYRAVVKTPDSAASHLALLAISTLVRSATTLADLEEKRSGDAPLWPQDTPENQVGMIVAAASMNELLNVTRRVATSNVTVLLTGETGTGKELLARALHDASPRRDKPFIPFNCTAVARDMLDSQLFGYRRGAFTGAQEAFQGIVRAAAGGTLFLDEIGEMPLDVQPKLLRFLESSEIHPLGEPRPIAVDVRVVAATNANLEQLVAEGRFREDLFYRLNVVRLQVPPLRERREEIPLLAQHFIDTFSRDGQKTGLRLAEETMEYLVLYKWPGNVRQLANELRRMVALAESGAVLMPEHLSQEIASSRRTIPASQRELAPTEFVVRMDQPMSAAMEHLERSMIQYAMTIAEGRQEDAAQILGLSRKGLYLKRLRLKMASPSLREEEEEEEAGEAAENIE